MQSTSLKPVVHGKAVTWRLLAFLHAIISDHAGDPQAIVGKNFGAALGLGRPMDR